MRIDRRRVKFELSMAFMALAFVASPARAEDAACPRVPKSIQKTHTMVPYPTVSQRRGERGGVILSVHLDQDGSPDKVDITHSSGAPNLDNATKSYVA